MRLDGPQGRSGQVRKISPPNGIRSLDRPARSQSLYRLPYPAHGNGVTSLPNFMKIRQLLPIFLERHKHKGTMSHAYNQIEGTQGIKVGGREGGDNKKLKRKVLSNSEADIFGQTG